jgi:hypothetical protein
MKGILIMKKLSRREFLKTSAAGTSMFKVVLLYDMVFAGR